MEPRMEASSCTFESCMVNVDKTIAHTAMAETMVSPGRTLRSCATGTKTSGVDESCVHTGPTYHTRHLAALTLFAWCVRAIRGNGNRHTVRLCARLHHCVATRTRSRLVVIPSPCRRVGLLGLLGPSQPPISDREGWVKTESKKLFCLNPTSTHSRPT